MSEPKTFDDLIAGDKKDTPAKSKKKLQSALIAGEESGEPEKVDIDAVIQEKKTASPTKTKKVKAVKETTVTVLDETKVNEPVEKEIEYLTTEVEEPVDDPTYAIQYYRGEPKNWGAASIWFGFAYLIFGFAIMGVSAMLNGFMDELNLSPSSTVTWGLYALVGVVGFVAFICAVVGFFRARANGHRWWLGLIGIGMVAVTAASTWLLFIYL